jgi:hypothetical protein
MLFRLRFQAETLARIEKRKAAELSQEAPPDDIIHEESEPLLRDAPHFTSYKWPQVRATTSETLTTKTEAGIWTIPQSTVRRFIDGRRMDRLHPGLTC